MTTDHDEKSNFKARMMNWVLNVTWLAVTVILISVTGPEIETRWFPAYSKFNIIEIKPSPKSRSVVEVEYVKFRDCFPQGYAWYQGDFGLYKRQLEVRSRRVPVAPSLPVGRHRTKLEVDISPDEFSSGIYAEIFSRCHPFWITRSVILP